MNPQDNRMETRVPTKAILVRVDGLCGKVYGFARDISNSGMGLRTFTTSQPYPIEVGEKVQLEFRLPDSESVIVCQAEVVWNCETNGVPCEIMRQGFRFTDPELAARSGIKKWIEAIL